MSANEFAVFIAVFFIAFAVFLAVREMLAWIAPGDEDDDDF